MVRRNPGPQETFTNSKITHLVDNVDNLDNVDNVDDDDDNVDNLDNLDNVDNVDDVSYIQQKVYRWFTPSKSTRTDISRQAT